MQGAHVVCALVPPMTNPPANPLLHPTAPLAADTGPALPPLAVGALPDAHSAQLSLPLVLEGLGHGVWDWDLVSGAEYFSPRLKAMVGYADEDDLSLSAHLDALTHPDDVPGMQADRQAHWEGRAPRYQNEHRVRHRSGRWVWVLTRGLVISRDAQGLPLRMVGTHTDITQRKQAELDHQHTRERLELALQGANDGLWDWDIVGDCTHYSPRFRTLLGYGSEEEFGQRFSFRSQLHPDDLARVTSAVRAHLRGRTPLFDEDYRLRTRDGSYRWFKGRGRCSGSDGQGGPARLTGHLTDISARVASDQARLALQTQLHEAHQREAVHALASQVGHELQELLADVQTQLQQAQAALLGGGAGAACAQGVEGVQGALQATERARHVVSQMHAFGSSQTQHMQLVDLSGWVVQQCARLRALAPAHARLVEHVGTEPLRVVADHAQLEQVLNNLCFHAWQTGAQTPVRVEVSVQADPAGGVRWVVQDDGPCIAPDALPHVLEPFHPSRRASGRLGTSGLAVVARLVAAHQGRVAVHSPPGQGCRVEVWLPRAAEPARPSTGQPPGAHPTPQAPAPQSVAAAAPVAPALATLSPASPQARTGWHVVYIDDYEAMVYLMVRMLKKRGVRVSAFERASDALAHVKAHPDGVDLLVTDYNMPEYSGLDVVREVARCAPGLPVVIASGHVTPGLQAQARAAGVLEVLNKHDSVDELAAKLADLLHHLPSRPVATDLLAP